MEKIIAIGQMRATNDKVANREQVINTNIVCIFPKILCCFLFPQVQQIVESAVKQNACVCINEMDCNSHLLKFYRYLVCIFTRML